MSDGLSGKGSKKIKKNHKKKNNIQNKLKKNNRKKQKKMNYNETR